MIRIVYLVLLLMITRVACTAGPGRDTVHARALQGIIVTGKVSGFDVKAPVPAQVLSGERLEQLNSLSVADAVRYFSGVQLKDYGGIGGLKTINVRELGSAHVAVLYDGVPVSDVRNGQVDLGKFSLENIEAIELFNAQRPTIFQPARGFFSSSILSLRSKMPRFEQGKSHRGTVTARGGSFGMVSPAVSWHQQLPGHAALSVSLAYLRANGKYRHRYTNGTYDTTIVRQNGDIESARAEVGLHVPIGDRMILSLKGFHHSSERGLPGAILAGRFTNAQRQLDRGSFFQGSFRAWQDERHRLMVNVKYNRDYSRYSDPEYPVDGGEVDVFRQEEIYLSVAGALRVTPWCELSVASDFAYNTLWSNLPDFPGPSRRSSWNALSLQGQWERLTVQASLLGCLIDERAKRGNRRDDQRVACPVISASWQPARDPGFRLRAFYKESFRVPTFNDLYYTPMTPAALRPERTMQYNMGFAWEQERPGTLRAIAVQGDVFHNRVKDKIIAFPSGNVERWTMINLGKAAITGAEINARAVLSLHGETRTRMGLTYTWQRAIDITPGDTRGARLPYSPARAGTLTATLLRPAWHLNYCFVYTGERFYQRDNTPASREPPWYTHDLSVGYLAAWHDVPLRLDAEVNNLLNQYYDVVRNYPMPGRSYRVSLSMNI